MGDVLRHRIVQFGATIQDEKVETQFKAGELQSLAIIYTLSGVKDSARLKGLLSRQGKLGFYETFELKEIISDFADVARELDKDIKIAKELYEKTGNKTPEWEFYNTLPKDTSPFSGEVVLTDTSSFLWRLLYPSITSDGKVREGPAVGMSKITDTSRVNLLLSLPSARRILPVNLELMWEANPIPVTGALRLYAIKRPIDPEDLVSNEEVKSVTAAYDVNGKPELDLKFDGRGSWLWENATSKAANENPKRCIAIVMDSRVFSAPRVQQSIRGGNSQITGIEKAQEAEDLANLLKNGPLPVQVIVH
jgi:SecD/SecF fusion protein